MQQEITSFYQFDIAEKTLRALTEMGFSAPTPIQAQVIPILLGGQDVIAQAPTGTGKTCAFGIPAVTKADVEADFTQILILCPTRELVMQTAEELKRLTMYAEGIRVLPIYGGQNIQKQLSALRRKPQIVVGTPGRIMDHLRRRTLKLEQLQTLILDEADEMLNMGFREDIDVILLSAPQEKQVVLFSATLPAEIVEISRNYQREPVSVRVKNQEQEIPNIQQFYMLVTDKQKTDALIRLISENDYELSLVFTNTKKRAQELADTLKQSGFKADCLHGDMRQRERDTVMKQYRGGELNILVATDVAARGIDVDNIEAVFNYDVPTDEEYYVHRIGRTARANRTGCSYTLATPKQRADIKNFERITKMSMQKLDWTASEENAPAAEQKAPLKQLFDKLGENRDAEKETLTEALAAYNMEYNTDYTVLDIAAALLAEREKAAAAKPMRTETDRRREPARQERSSAPRRSSSPRSDSRMEYYQRASVWEDDGANFGTSDVRGNETFDGFKKRPYSGKNFGGKRKPSSASSRYGKSDAPRSADGGEKKRSYAPRAEGSSDFKKRTDGKPNGEKSFGERSAAGTYGRKPYSDKPREGGSSRGGKTYGNKPTASGGRPRAGQGSSASGAKKTTGYQRKSK